jgi:hypothetical protein
MTYPFQAPVDFDALPEYTAMVELLNPNNLTSIGMFQFSTINAVLYYNAVGSYSIQLPYTDAVWAQMMGGDFIVRVNWRGLFTFGGKCEQPVYSNSLPGSVSGGSVGSGGGAGQFITLVGADYLAILANRICYPDPTVAWSAQKPGNQSVIISGPLETAIKYFVNYNVGPAAIAGRKFPLLDIATDQRRGPPAGVNYSVNFTSGQSLNLMEVIRALIAQAYGAAGVGMGVQITQNGNRLLFDVYLNPDKTATATFSESLGNLTSVSLSLTDPTCTDALVQGATPMTKVDGVTPDPTAHSFITATTSSTPWTKIEHYVNDANESIPNNLNTAAQNEINAGARGPNLNTTTTDSPYLVFGRDYHIGDKVTVEVRPGVTYTDIVSSVTLSVDAGQSPVVGVVPVIGVSNNAGSTDKNVIAQLSARIKTLEQKLATQGR